MQPFHLAFSVKDIDSTKDFYSNMLGCKQGREASNWVDFDFFGNLISAHVTKLEVKDQATSNVDNEKVPLKHFGAILAWNQWEELAARLKMADVKFILEPHVRFKDLPGEQGTFFIADPSGNALEFKTFKNMAAIFAR